MRYSVMATTDQTGGALAILIDADNANPAIVKGLIDEVAKFGRATVRRIYGDWTTPNLGSWKDVLLEHSIQPIQQFAYTTGKNATDSALIIDAMDLLYAGNLDGFCIVSSDSDFTRLASRLKESGKRVYGFGEKKTPQPVRRRLRPLHLHRSVHARGRPERRAARRPRSSERDREFLDLVGGAVDDASDDSGWAHLGAVGTNLTKKRPDFDSRNYGYSKLSDLLDASQALRGQARRTRRAGQAPSRQVIGLTIPAFRGVSASAQRRSEPPARQMPRRRSGPSCPATGRNRWRRAAARCRGG